MKKDFFLLAENVNYFINPTTFQIKSMKRIQDLAFLEVQYSYSAHIGKGLFPNEVIVERGFKENNNIKLVYTKIVLNEKQSIIITCLIDRHKNISFTIACLM